MARPVVSNQRKILCVFPKHHNDFATFRYSFKFFPQTKALMPPQGILTIAAYLPKEWEVRFIDENVHTVKDADYAWADVVLTSGMHTQREFLESIAENAHAHGKLAVIGGPSVSACPDWYPTFDMLHVGEMGDATDELIAMLDRSIERPSAQLQFKTVNRLPLEDFPIPAYHLIKAQHYLMVSVQWSSGCPYSCEFCDIPALYGRNPRYKSAERLIAELEVILAQDPLGAVFFVDDNLIGNKKAFKLLLPKLADWQKRTNYRLKFLGECSLNLAQDKPILELMRAAHFTDLFFGVESPEELALEAMDKHQNTRMPIPEAVKIINSYGIGLTAGMIIGLDTDSDQTVERLTAFQKETQVPLMVMNVLYAPPKTALWERLNREGRIIPRDSVVASNVKFKDGEEVVLRRWRKAIERASDPQEMFDRFRYHAATTYKNRLPLPSARGRFTRTQVLAGLWSIATMIVLMGIFASYRRQYWRFAVAMLRAGMFEQLVYASTMSYHVVRFRDDVLKGAAKACFHAEQSTMAEEKSPGLLPDKSLVRLRLAARSSSPSL